MMEHRHSGKRMEYGDFTLQKLKKDFGLQVDEQRDLFAAVEPVAGSDLLNDTLQETVQLAIAINTEKARSGNDHYPRVAGGAAAGEGAGQPVFRHRI